MGDFEVVQYSKSQIKRAGDFIAKNDSSSPEYNYHITIVDNWRAVHALPLNCIAEIVKETLKNKNNFFIVQRLKRCESIIGKLRRPNRTSLDRMQDLGGCRIIVPTLEDVYETVEIVKETIQKKGHIIYSEDDYIKAPPLHSGYRSYHIVVKYQSDDEYNNMFIELQVRTRLQHSWATAVEVIDCVENETLKSGTGNEDFRYFFKLASALFSIEEHTTIVAGVPVNNSEIIGELYQIENIYHIREKLSAYSNAIRMTGERPGFADYYLLVTDMRKQTTSVRAYRSNEISLATEDYNREEKIKNNGIDVVLVAGKSFEVIRESYPNFFLEAQEFLTRISKLCAAYPEVPSVSLDTSLNAFKLSDMFSAKAYPGNIPRELNVLEDGIGEVAGDTIYCPSWAITLSDSYLRFSGIIRNLEDLLKNKDIIPYAVNGSAIIASSFGACFYVDKDDWGYVSEEPCIVIQPRKGVDEKLLFLAIAWLKSNLCTWDMIWNRHSHSVFAKETFFSLYVPNLDDENRLSLYKLVEEILVMERDFVNYYHSVCDSEDIGVLEEKVAEFNDRILILLKKIETIFLDFYEVTPDNRAIINSELRLKGYFTYT